MIEGTFSSVAFDADAFDAATAEENRAFEQGTFDASAFDAQPIPGVTIQVAGVLPAMQGSVGIIYSSQTVRPVVGKVSTTFRDTAALQTAAHQARWQESTPLAIFNKPRYRDASALTVQTHGRYNSSLQLQVARDARWRDAARGGRISSEIVWEEARHLQRATGTRWQDAQHVPERVARQSFRNGIPVGRLAGSRYQDAQHLPEHTSAHRFQDGIALVVSDRSRWQDATNLPPGQWHDAGPPPDDGGGEGPPDNPNTIIVPVRRVYVMLNTSSLYRVDGHIFLPTFGMNMSLDADSWTWSFSATLPATELANVVPDSDGTPATVECTVNGVPYRFKVTRVSRDRGFATDVIRIDGRGLGDDLDAPTAPVMNFGNTADRTAQQLMADVLSINGAPLDWSIDWQITDWLVPANTWSKTSVYIEAVNEIAAAAGAYVQPTPATQELRVLPRFPYLPRDWTLEMADYELPDSIAVREGITWVEKPRYNRVYVQGQTNGRRGQATIVGTAGDICAPTVVDSLITHVDAERQRAISILGDTGRIATYTLGTAVGVKDGTGAPIGIIPPGKFIRYIENGVAKIGITRSVSVDIGTPEINQSIESKSMNPYKRLLNLLPGRPLQVGVILAVDGGSANVQEPGGGVSIVRGADGLSAGANVFFRDGVIEGSAPTLPTDVIDL